jgi:glutathione S-transferase
MVSISIPPEYGWVILGAGIGPVLTSMYLGGQVMGARKKFSVEYPNCYAVPGYHKNADEFNRVQRGHQNFLEGSDQYMFMTFIGGLKHPIACAIGSVLYVVGSVLYQKGYADTTLDVQSARYKKGAGIKWIGYFTSFYATCALAYSVITA